MLMTLLALIFRSKRGRKVKFEHFLPDWWADRKSPAALMAKFRGLTALVWQAKRG